MLMGPSSSPVDASVVIPVKDGAEFLPACLESLLNQDFTGKWEVSIYNDGSQDDTQKIIDEFSPRFLSRGIGFVFSSGTTPGGVGFAKNRAAMASFGLFLCFCDADDVCLPSRIRLQFEGAKELADKTENTDVFLGSRFLRDPSDSTVRYARWANGLNLSELYNQVYTSHGPTLIAPTWFLSRSLFNKLGGFREVPRGFPEDLDLFYRALEAGAVLRKIDEPLVVYRYHAQCASFGVSEHAIWNMRLEHLAKHVLPKWKAFTIWNAGKQGKALYKSLTEEYKKKVTHFCDVDERKIRHGFYEPYDEVLRKVTGRIPIVHVREASPPFIVCVKLDMTGGDLERLIADSHWKEGDDYVLFS